METTSIRVRIENKQALESFRSHPRETIDDVLTRVLADYALGSLKRTILANGQREEQRS